MIKLYLNENVPETIARELVLRGYGVVSTHSAGNSGLSDKEQLNFAIREGRILFTFNVKDFAKIHLEYATKGLNHKGIILSKQMPVGMVIKALIKIILSKTEKEIENNLIWLSEFL